MKEVLWCFMYIKETKSGENYKAAYKLWKKCNTKSRIHVDAKHLLNQKNYIYKAKRITPTESYEISENITLKILNNTEDHTKLINYDNKMVTVDTQHQMREEERYNMSLQKRMSKYKETEVGQHIVTKKLTKIFK